MENLLSILNTMPEYTSLLESLSRRESAAVTGIGQVCRSHMIAGIYKETSAPIVILCQDDLAVRKIGIGSMRIYIQADNLFLISPYRFIDPEVNSSLDATKMGLDNMWLPKSRTWSMGIKIKL